MPAQAYDLGRLAFLRTRILDEVCYPYYGLTVAGDLFAQFAGDLHRAVCPAADVRVVAESLRNLAGRELTARAAAEVAWRVAGNLHRLRQGRSVHPWSGQSEPEWVPLEIVSALRRRRRFKARTDDQKARAGEDGLVRQYGVKVVARVLAGLPAGLFYERFWSSEYCELVKVSVGFSRWNRARYSRVVSRVRDRPYTDPREFFGMRLSGLVMPEKCRPGEVALEYLKATASAVAANRGLMSLRTRDDYECPLSYSTDEMECYDCHAGTDRCRAACHATSYVTAWCPRCERADAYHDPSGSEKVCVDCATAVE